MLTITDTAVKACPRCNGRLSVKDSTGFFGGPRRTAYCTSCGTEAGHGKSDADALKAAIRLMSRMSGDIRQSARAHEDEYNRLCAAMQQGAHPSNLIRAADCAIVDDGLEWAEMSVRDQIVNGRRRKAEAAAIRQRLAEEKERARRRKEEAQRKAQPGIIACPACGETTFHLGTRGCRHEGKCWNPACVQYRVNIIGATSEGMLRRAAEDARKKAEKAARYALP